jgi:hypothetical protein
MALQQEALSLQDSQNGRARSDLRNLMRGQPVCPHPVPQHAYTSARSPAGMFGFIDLNLVEQRRQFVTGRCVGLVTE